MSSSTKRKTYSAFYKIYRRFRYISHIRKQKRKEQKALHETERLVQSEARQRLREHIKAEKEKEKLKAKFEKEQIKKNHALLKKERIEYSIPDQEKKVELKQQERERLKSDRIFQKKRRRRLLRFYLKIQARGILKALTSLNINYFRRKIGKFRENRVRRHAFTVITINSTLLFLIAYFAVYIFSQLITIVAATFFNYPTIWYFDQIYFNISPDQWNHDSVKVIFSAGPLLSLLLGLIFIIVYSKVREMNSIFKLFFLWGFLHSISMLFGAMLVGTLFETGIGHVISWMYIMDTGKVLYSIFSIFIMVVVGLLITKSILISANSYFNILTKDNRRLFVLSQVVAPYFLGNIILVAIRQPIFMFYETFVTLSMGIIIFPMIVMYRSYQELYFDEEKRKPRLKVSFILIMLGIIAFYRGLLSIGIRIGG
jgi:hypothetical protein